MTGTNASAGRVLGAYALVCGAVYAVTRLEPLPGIGPYVHLLVAAIFLLAAVRWTRSDPRHFGTALGGLLEPTNDARPGGPWGVFDLGRAILAAIPTGLRELAVAMSVIAVVFPLYAVGYYVWTGPTTSFQLALPPDLLNLGLAQIVVVALPEEAFFRGYLQTSLTDIESRRLRFLGVELAPAAWLSQAALFAAIHFLVEPSLARLSVFFPGLLFGWLRAWRGGIGAAVAIHAMSNLYSEILARSWL